MHRPLRSGSTIAAGLRAAAQELRVEEDGLGLAGEFHGGDPRAAGATLAVPAGEDAMSMYLPNPDLQPTGFEPAEFIDIPLTVPEPVPRPDHKPDRWKPPADSPAPPTEG